MSGAVINFCTEGTIAHAVARRVSGLVHGNGSARFPFRARARREERGREEARQRGGSACSIRAQPLSPIRAIVTHSQQAALTTRRWQAADRSERGKRREREERQASAQHPPRTDHRPPLTLAAPALRFASARPNALFPPSAAAAAASFAPALSSALSLPRRIFIAAVMTDFPDIVLSAGKSKVSRTEQHTSRGRTSGAATEQRAAARGARGESREEKPAVDAVLTRDALCDLN